MGSPPLVSSEPDSSMPGGAASCVRPRSAVARAGVGAARAGAARAGGRGGGGKIRVRVKIRV